MRLLLLASAASLLTGCAQETLQSVAESPDSGDIYDDSSPSYSPDGMKIAYMSTRSGVRDIFVMDADGANDRQLTAEAGANWQPAWSPDGAKIAFISDRPGNDEIFVMNADGSGAVNLSQHPAQDWNPAWSPDSEKILFMSTRDGDWREKPEDNWELYAMNADGSGQTRLTDTPGYELPTGQAWSPDGSEIVFCSTMDIPFEKGPDQFDDFDLYLMNADGSNIRRLTDDPGQESYAYWSPDGQKISYTHVIKDAPTEPTTGGENYEIYTINPDGTGKTKLTDNPNYDFEGWWSPDSRKMVYSSSAKIPMAIYVMNADGSNKVRLTNKP